jgi:molybdate transport system substrate-binding protein
VAAQPAATPALDPLARGIGVFAAASLTDAFNAEGESFAHLHPAARAKFNFLGSSALATQINEGAPADVFAAADLPNMQKVAAAGNLDGASRIFASNRLQIVVGAGNPKAIKGLADLARPGLVVVLCAPQVPCGTYASQALRKAVVKVTPASQEQDVKGVLTKVALGEADAGIVYVTDIKAGGARVAGVDIPDDQNVVARYPIALVKGAGPAANPSGGRAFIEFIVSKEGQDVLKSFGFSAP